MFCTAVQLNSEYNRLQDQLKFHDIRSRKMSAVESAPPRMDDKKNKIVLCSPSRFLDLTYSLDESTIFWPGGEKFSL